MVPSRMETFGSLNLGFSTPPSYTQFFNSVLPLPPDVDPEPKLAPIPYPQPNRDLLSSHYANFSSSLPLSSSQLSRDQHDCEHILEIFLLLFLNFFLCLKECYNFNHKGKKIPTSADQGYKSKTINGYIKSSELKSTQTIKFLRVLVS